MSQVLRDCVHKLSAPLSPQPTDTAPQLAPIPGIRAVIFDIYGTLLISGSGDISLASSGSRGAAAEAALVSVGLYKKPAAYSSHDEEYLFGDQIVKQLHAAIRDAHEQSESEYPEVEIRECWQTALEQNKLTTDSATLERLAVEFECRVNPIWPMPGLDELLSDLTKRGCKLGIVSNAQFFTPLAFEPLTGKSLSDLGFIESLSIWSYEQREAKPGVVLYEMCANQLAELSISPSETLYVGNDLRNDVWPASQVGFKTVLFAGDARSLRWRRDDPAVANVQPDAVVTDLRQIEQLLSY